MGAQINSKGICNTIGGIRTSANNLAAQSSKLGNKSLSFNQVLKQENSNHIDNCLRSSKTQLGSLLEDIKDSKQNIIKNVDIDTTNIIAKIRQDAIMLYDVMLKNPL